MTDEAVINIASLPLNNSLLDASQDKSMIEPWMDLFSASARSRGGSNKCYLGRRWDRMWLASPIANS